MLTEHIAFLNDFLNAVQLFAQNSLVQEYVHCQLQIPHAQYLKMGFVWGVMWHTNHLHQIADMTSANCICLLKTLIMHESNED